MIKKISTLLCLLISVSYSQYSGPKIVSQEKEYDFGTVVQGEKVKHDFVITNSGEDKLIIDKVHASCGCTAALPEKKELMPGESTNIKVEFNSRGRSGEQVKYITIQSNDDSSPDFVLKLYGKVVKEEIDTLKNKDTTTLQKEKSN